MHQRTAEPRDGEPNAGETSAMNSLLQEAADWKCGKRNRQSLSQSLVCPFPKAHDKESSREYCGGRSSCQTLIRGEKTWWGCLGHVDFDLCRSWLYCEVFESLPSLGGLSSQLFKIGGNLPESELKGMLKTREWWSRSKPYMIYILQKQIVRGLTRTPFIQIQTQSA